MKFGAGLSVVDCGSEGCLVSHRGVLENEAVFSAIHDDLKLLTWDDLLAVLKPLHLAVRLRQFALEGDGLVFRCRLLLQGFCECHADF